MSDPPSWYSHVTPPPNKKNWFFYSHLSHHSQKKQNKERTKKSPTRHVWSTIILCNFQSCCCCYFCFGRCIVWGKISNYWFITFLMKNFFTWNHVDPALWNRVFPDFFLKKQNWTNMVGYHGLGWNKILIELGWILIPEFFSEKKQN